jgi:DNA helicase-2/ATP-dependent DNA helicase PcrA
LGIILTKTDVPSQERPDSGQLAAIAADAPAILLVAGAGTGKTRVLAARLAHVLRRRASALASASASASGAASGSKAQLMTLVLSFTSSAAQEICAQAAALPGGAAATDARAVWAGTFHSFALRLLGQYPYLGTGLSRFTIADTADQQAAMQAALAELRAAGEKGASAHALLRRVSVWKEQGLDERRAAAALRDRWDGDTSTEERLAAAVYPLYQRCLRARGKVR